MMTMRWPTGTDGALAFHGIGRDLVTPLSGHNAIEAALDMLSAKVQRSYQLVSFATGPDWPKLQALVGEHVIKGYRRRHVDMAAARLDRKCPLGTLLDNFAACSLISGWVHILRPGSPWAAIRADPARRRRMARACAGYAAESEALTGDFLPGKSCQVGPVQHPEDLLGWHEMAEAATMKCGAPAGSKCGATQANLSQCDVPRQRADR